MCTAWAINKLSYSVFADNGTIDRQFMHVYGSAYVSMTKSVSVDLSAINIHVQMRYTVIIFLAKIIWYLDYLPSVGLIIMMGERITQ